MSEVMVDKDSRPWYQQGWPWLLIALPASAVVGGILTIIIAVESPNALVVDDYYKQGLAINQEKHRLAQARSMQLKALVRNDGGRLSVTLESLQPVSEPTLTLNIIHATRSELDQTLRLQRNSDGSYQAAVEHLRTGTWYLRLEDPQQTWEIHSRIRIEGPFQTYLTARD